MQFCDIAMEVQELFRMNSEFMQNMAVHHLNAIKTIVADFGKKINGGGQGGAYLDERKFRDMEVFGGKEDLYKEWAMKVKAKVKEHSKEMHDEMIRAEEERDEIDFDVLGEEEARYATVLFNMITMLTSGPAFVMHQAVPMENGLESWRRLARRYNPMTPIF